MTEEDIRCEFCRTEVDDKELDDEGLCHECHDQVGQDRMESYNDLD